MSIRASPNWMKSWKLVVLNSNPPKKLIDIKGENIDETKSENRNRLKSSKTESEPTIKDDDQQVITHISFNDLNKFQLNNIIKDNNKQNSLPVLNYKLWKKDIKIKKEKNNDIWKIKYSFPDRIY